MPAKRQDSPVDIPYLQPLPSGKFRYRRRVPPDLVPHVKRTEWTSKPIADRTEAVAVAARLEIIHDNAISRFRNGGTYDELDAIEAIEARARLLRDLRPDALQEAIVEALGEAQARAAFVASAAGPGLGRGGPFSAEDLLAQDRAAFDLAAKGGRYVPKKLPLLRAYEEDKARNVGKKRDEKRLAYAVASWERAGLRDADFLNLQRAEVEKFVAWAKAQKKWAPATVKRRVVSIQGIHTRTIVHYGLPASTAWRLLDLQGSAEDAKIPFNAGHLEALDKHLAKGTTPLRVVTGLHLMRYCGLGPGEIVGLARRDFVLTDAIPYVIVRINETRGLKTGETRKRRVPLLGPAFDSAQALLEAVKGENVFASKKGKLDANGYSAAINDVIRDAGIPKSKRLTAYSLRHGLAEAMQQAQISERLRKYIMGHAKSGVHDKYGATMALRVELKAALEAAHPLLGRVEDAEYLPSELMPRI